MQIKPKLVKGLKLVSLLEQKYQQFAQGKKVLYLDQNEYIKLFNHEANSWDTFQLIMCKLIEQAFLTAHFDKLKDLSDKAAMAILDMKTKKQKKGKNKKKKLIKEEPWFDSENLLFSINDDDKDFDQLLYNLGIEGSKSHEIRKFYSGIAMEWDDEVNLILDQAYYETNPFLYVPSYPVARYYSYPQKYYFQG